MTIPPNLTQLYRVTFEIQVDVRAKPESVREVAIRALQLFQWQHWDVSSMIKDVNPITRPLKG